MRQSILVNGRPPKIASTKISALGFVRSWRSDSRSPSASSLPGARECPGAVGLEAHLQPSLGRGVAAHARWERCSRWGRLGVDTLIQGERENTDVLLRGGLVEPGLHERFQAVVATVGPVRDHVLAVRHRGAGLLFDTTGNRALILVHGDGFLELRDCLDHLCCGRIRLELVVDRPGLPQPRLDCAGRRQDGLEAGVAELGGRFPVRKHLVDRPGTGGHGRLLEGPTLLVAQVGEDARVHDQGLYFRVQGDIRGAH